VAVADVRISSHNPRWEIKMDLGLLYEFAVPQPWESQHPWGQRMAERRVYKEDMVIVGTPEECPKKFVNLPHEAVMNSIELLGTFVIPELAKRGAGTMASALTGEIRKAEAAIV
jgi:hypothetical protein